MFILGLISLLQILFLPGYLFLGYYHFKRGLLQTLILSFGLSLAINYWIVLLLTTGHIYNRITVLSIFAMELLLLIWQWRHFFHHPLINEHTDVSHHLKSATMPVLLVIKREFKTLNVAKVTALFFIAYLIAYFVHMKGPSQLIFSDWDALFNWNRWALDWYQNHFPKITYEYPQLLPTNISLTYQFIGNSTVQYFAKIACFVFPFMMIATLWNSANQQKNKGYYWAIPFLVIMAIIIFKDLAIAGYADIPVACLSLLGFYALMLSKSYESECEAKKSIYISAVLFAGAALTKQGGAIFIPLFPVMLYFFIFNDREFQQKTRLCLISLAIMLIYFLPWYIYKFIQIHYGGDVGITSYLLHGGGYTALPAQFSSIDKIDYGIKIMLDAVNQRLPLIHVNTRFIEVLFPILLILGCYLDSFVRRLFCLMVLPGALIWLLFVSYDLRNIAVAIPFLAIALGISLEKLLNCLKSILLSPQPKFYRLSFLLICLILAIFALNTLISSSRLINSQLTRQKQIGDPAINQILYDYFETHSLNGVIMTNYLIIPYLPILPDSPNFSEHYTRNTFNDLPNLLKAIQTSHPMYLFIWKNHSATSDSTMPGETYVLSTKRCQIITDNDSILFCKVNYSDEKN